MAVRDPPPRPQPRTPDPVVTYGLIAACFLVFFYELSLSDAGLEAFFLRWGAIPDKASSAIAHGDWLSQAHAGLISSQFLHGGWLHILGNMLYPVDLRQQHRGPPGACDLPRLLHRAGIVAGLTQVYIDPNSSVPLVGASGAIAGVLGAYLILYPSARVVSLVFLGYFITTVNVPAVIVLGLWFILQLITGVASLGASSADSGGVATFAHVGGFVMGMVVGCSCASGRRRRDRVG